MKHVSIKVIRNSNKIVPSSDVNVMLGDTTMNVLLTSVIKDVPKIVNNNKHKQINNE